jgi:hypothetical protein
MAFFVCIVASSVPLLLPRCASKRYMVLRTGPAAISGYGTDGAWAAFVPSQIEHISLQGCISQPAHAALAGRLAAALNGKIFEAVQQEILDAIANHDAGWSEEDLAALEQAEHNPPVSFISMPAVIAVQAWRRSIEYAASRSPLSGYVVRSHFCLLAPRDGNVQHELFRKEQETQLRLTGLGAKYNLRDLDRFVAYLGFCDLLSLHLCSGCQTDFELRLAHPAHPSSKDAKSIPVSIRGSLLHLKGINVADHGGVYLNAWEKTHSGAFRNRRYEWILQ